MRVAVVTMDTRHLDDGPRTWRLARVIRRLKERGNEVIVYCHQWWDGDVDEFEQNGISYRAMTTDRSAGQFATRLPFALRRDKPDIVHASYAPPSLAVAATAGKLLTRRPVLVEWYGDIPVDGTRRIPRAAARRASALVTPSRYVQTRVRELGAADEDTHIIPDWIDIERIQDIPPADGPDILTARRLDEEANVDMMLLGLAELRDRDWTAIVIGDGPARHQFEAKAAELRIDDRVRFVGEVPRDQRIAHYRAARVFVQTARRCPFPRELLWALACGCAGVVDYQEHSAAHELVERFDRGFLTTGSEELSEAILEAAALDERTSNDAFDRYDDDRVLDQYFDVYDSLL